MSLEAEFWVAVATVLFVGILVYTGAHRAILDAIDGRRRRIEAELAEAERLRREAEELVAQYQAKQAEAARAAQAMIETARAEAERYAAEQKTRMDEFVARRTKMAETKIAQAEAQAMAEVRAAAADTAVAAATEILSRTAKGPVAEQLIARGISDVQAKLN